MLGVDVRFRVDVEVPNLRMKVPTRSFPRAVCESGACLVFVIHQETPCRLPHSPCYLALRKQRASTIRLNC
jgi:hypothetical protein